MTEQRYVWSLSVEYQGYDTYDSFVVVAGTALRARELAAEQDKFSGPECWLDATKSECLTIGIATGDISERVVCGSFNAG